MLRRLFTRLCGRTEEPTKPVTASQRQLNIEQLCGLLRGFEGLRLEPYKCPAGVWTIGYGATRTLGRRPVTALTKPITQTTAEQMLWKSASRFYDAMEKALRADASDGAKVAFASLAFNMGVAAIKNSDALRAYNAGHLHTCKREFLEWRGEWRGKGKSRKFVVLPGLVNRRAVEWKLISEVI